MYQEKLKEIVLGVSKEAAKYAGDKYVSDGILESVEVMEIIAEIEDVFGIAIEPQYIVPEYFESIEMLEKLVQDVKKG